MKERIKRLPLWVKVVLVLILSDLPIIGWLIIPTILIYGLVVVIREYHNISDEKDFERHYTLPKWCPTNTDKEV